jgi:hypothetical protein
MGLTLIQMTIKKACSRVAGRHIWLPRQPIGEREGWRHAVAVFGSSSLGMGWWWRELKESKNPPCNPEYTKTAPKPAVSCTCWLENRRKSVHKIYSHDVFWGLHELKKFLLLKAMWSYTTSNFRESYMPPVIWIRVKEGNMQSYVKFALWRNPFNTKKPYYLSPERLGIQNY